MIDTLLKLAVRNLGCIAAAIYIGFLLQDVAAMLHNAAYRLQSVEATERANSFCLQNATLLVKAVTK
ncbi:MAG: hypothetical protein KGJ13_07500 [Patescibacteria group bacterium]|nr:hypothetical protein [Patescibacteria group bacterium]